MFGSTEIIVKKRAKYNARVISIILYVAVVLITAWLYKVAGAVAFYPFPFLLVGAWLLSKYLRMMANIEYEYSFLDGRITIDKLINQTKRVHILQIEIGEITEFGPATNEKVKSLEAGEMKVVHCDTDKEDDINYYFICKNEDKGINVFIFTPNEKFLNALSQRSQMIGRIVSKQF